MVRRTVDQVSERKEHHLGGPGVGKGCWESAQREVGEYVANQPELSLGRMSCQASRVKGARTLDDEAIA